MVGDKERFLPSHEYVFTLGEITVCEIRSFGLFSQRTPGRKPRPMVQVCLFRGTPFLITSLESMFSTDDFSFKKGSQGRVIFCQALDSKIATEIRLSHIHMLNLDINTVNLAI